MQQHGVDVVDAHAGKPGVHGLDDVLLGEVVPGKAVGLLADAHLGLQKDAVAQAGVGREDLA